MALIKNVNIQRQRKAGGYIRVEEIERLSFRSRYVQATFALWADEAHAREPDAEPIVPVIAKLRLQGDVFDAWLGKAALAGRRGQDDDPIRGQLYRALVAGVGEQLWGAGLRGDELTFQGAREG